MQAAPSLENRPSTQLIDVMSLLKSFETRYKAEEQTKQLAIKVFQGIFFGKVGTLTRCGRHSGPKPEMQHNRRGRGVLTLT
jgi:hypothetical protein